MASQKITPDPVTGSGAEDAFAFHGRPDARVALPQSSILPNAERI